MFGELPLANDLQTSTIVKQALPHLRKYPEYCFSVQRLAFEARALSVINQNSIQSLFVNSFPSFPPFELPDFVKIPVLIHYDAVQHVLIQEDLGPHPLLSAWLAQDHELVEVSNLGHVLGHWFITFHKQGYARRKELSNLFQNLPVFTLLEETVVAPAMTALERVGSESAKKFAHELKEFWQNRVKDAAWEERTLCMGDLWPEAIMVLSPVFFTSEDGTSSRKTPCIGIFDWEFASWMIPSVDLAHFLITTWMMGWLLPVEAVPRIQAIFQACIEAYEHGIRTWEKPKVMFWKDTIMQVGLEWCAESQNACNCRCAGDRDKVVDCCAVCEQVLVKRGMQAIEVAMQERMDEKTLLLLLQYI